ncbi:transposase [Cryptosporangium arvum]|uniref:transposase n=1 Tax=Cryptosporangium arvum TaxID=80871 RepID=UPI0004AD2AEE
MRSSAHILTHLHGHRLGEWITSAQDSTPSPIARFATGLTNDLAAVTAGLSQPHSSGPVEGNVNRIKMAAPGSTFSANACSWRANQPQG